MAASAGAGDCQPPAMCEPTHSATAQSSADLDVLVTFTLDEDTLIAVAESRLSRTVDDGWSSFDWILKDENDITIASASHFVDGIGEDSDPAHCLAVYVPAGDYTLEVFYDTDDLIAHSAVIECPSTDSDTLLCITPPCDDWDLRFEIIPCIGDLDGDGIVGTSDLTILLAAWGRCPAPPTPCPADLDGDGQVGTSDLLLLLANWGPCCPY